jgi:hypothetical protein
MCDYAALSGDEAFVERGLLPFAKEVLRFFAEHYPRREKGRTVFSPSEAGEMWCGVRNAAEVICALRALLPRLIDLGQQQRWDPELLRAWQGMLDAVPPIPRGRFEMDPLTRASRVLPGDLLVPAEDMSQADPPYPINHQHTELFSIWPAKLMLRDAQDRKTAERSYDARDNRHLRDGWNLDVVFAACLGMEEEVDRWFDYHFDAIHTFPCGLAQESSPKQADCAAISRFPSMQALGTSIIPVLERLLQDYPDELIVLPCWPLDVPVRFALFSPFAGRVQVDYQPGDRLHVITERQIKVDVRKEWREQVALKVEHVT